jgi:hypothetical protein
MTLTQIKERYTGIQTKLKTIDTDGCLFLCLCSIIEEVTNAPADIIGIIQLSKKRGWLSDEFTVNDSLELLRAFTGKIWKRTEPKKLPEIIKDNGNLIRDLAKKIRKRIIIRSDKSILCEAQETIDTIEKIVPEEAEITDISFDDVTCEVII